MRGVPAGVCRLQVVVAEQPAAATAGFLFCQKMPSDEVVMPPLATAVASFSEESGVAVLYGGSFFSLAAGR